LAGKVNNIAEGGVMDLVLPLKGIYFDQIKSGTKTLEYRVINDYWSKRLIGKEYDRVILTKGYPRKDDHDRRIVRRWLGFHEMIITHEHFGNVPTWVYAVDVSSPQPSLTQTESNNQRKDV
jgi:ASC-1-like (ASCH) protein